MRGGTRAAVAFAIAACGACAACSRSPRSPTPAPVAPEPEESASTSATSPPLVEAPPHPAEPPAPLCGDAGHAALFVSPEHPMRGQWLNVVAVSEKPVDAQLVVSGPPRSTPAVAPERHGGPPYYWLARVEAPAAGTWHATLSRGDACGGEGLARKDVAVVVWQSFPPPAPAGSLWALRAAWSPAYEDLYSSWIEHLFDAPIDEQPSWPALHEVLRDRSRNFLFDHLGVGEDERGMVVRPDCADLPYFLRAYFSFKLGLPYAWSHCSRGEGGTAPTCGDLATVLDPFPPLDGKPQAVPAWADPDRRHDAKQEAAPPAPTPTPKERATADVKRFGEFLRTALADAAQSGAGRTAAKDESGDYYPVSLSVETLRPGTIFADPYGHVLVVAKRVPEAGGRGGVLFAVDGQPDGTVARKRFWRGNFLFAVDPSLGSAGFKRFRTVVRDRKGGLRKLDNAELADFSGTEDARGVDGFYDKVEDVLSPEPLDPMQAMLETLQALEEQVRTRVVSVENGRKFLASGKPPAEMPDGAKIFETTGDWEDFSTPSRDLRLLIAIDVTRGLPARVARRAERYAMPPGKTTEQVRAELDARVTKELDARNFTYTRTDGSEWTLRLADIVARQEALEMAYDPNDCVESRWGAAPGSEEASTCHLHAPEAQTTKMQGYRAWFHERRRPPR